MDGASGSDVPLEVRKIGRYVALAPTGLARPKTG
jgi:hypothetical protein